MRLAIELQPPAQGLCEDAPAPQIGETGARLALRDPDIRLMLQARSDEPGAFEELVERYRHRLVAVMAYQLDNAEEAEDLAQEVFLRIYQARKNYQPRSRFSTWLFTIANNLVLNCLRARRHRYLFLEGYGLRRRLVRDPDTGPQQKVQKAELAQRIRAALETLNERQRLAVMLNKFEDMNYAETAQAMGLTRKAVKSLLSRARTNLRAALSGYVYMDGEPLPEATGEDLDS
jgi:RNA polymerase sigma-70 factor (ECF subfamily)